LDIQAYLERINYAGPTNVTAETLRQLQLAHLVTVPFENLSIHSGEPIVLDDESLFDKIVRRRRGGFCYELNGLFAALLQNLGFNVTKLAAEVANSEGVYGPLFDHMTLMVSLDQPWLADVGFGDSFLEPLLLAEDVDIQQGRRTYRIVRDNGQLLLMQRIPGEDWKPQYRFTLEPHEYADYLEMCRYHQTSPESHFTRNRMCSRATSDGRITLSGMRLIQTAANGERLEQELTGDDEFASLLRKHFGIDMKG
jgi:N-hydroxyarylamine O-acetyltransferase